jgi:hypothetical protein
MSPDTDNPHRAPVAQSCRARANGSGKAWRSEDGQALVEFALILPVVLLLLFAIANFGLNAVGPHIDETHIVSLGARLAEVNENCIVKGSPHSCELGTREEGAFLKWLTEQGDNSQVKHATATMCSPTSKLGDYVEIKLTYKYNPLPLLKLKAAEVPVTSTAQMRIEQEPYIPYPTAC